MRGVSPSLTAAMTASSKNQESIRITYLSCGPSGPRIINYCSVNLNAVDVLTKTIPKTAASQTSVDWGHDEARTGGTARVLLWYLLVVHHGVFIFLVVGWCKLDTRTCAQYTDKRCTVSKPFDARQRAQRRGSITAFPTSTDTPQASLESRRWWERDVGGHRNGKRPGEAFY